MLAKVSSTKRQNYKIRFSMKVSLSWKGTSSHVLVLMQDYSFMLIFFQELSERPISSKKSIASPIKMKRNMSSKGRLWSLDMAITELTKSSKSILQNHHKQNSLRITNNNKSHMRIIINHNMMLLSEITPNP